MWLYENKKIASAVNGDITLKRLFGRWQVNTGPWHQTAPYTNRMWKGALQTLPLDFAPKDILLLGLGGGGMLKYLRKSFPNSKITAVEWDPVMVEIAGKINNLKKVKLVVGEASASVKKFAEDGAEFDLIILDLFEERKVANVVSNNDFINHLSRILKKKGWFLANIFSEPDKTKLIEQYFQKHRAWKYKYNNLALYTRKDYQQLPDGYYPYRGIKEFLQRDYIKSQARLISKGKVWGGVSDFGPIRIERYMSDTEPEIFSDEKFRLIIWQPSAKLDKPKGWRQSWGQMGTMRSGFAEIKNPEKYWLDWDTHAQRHRTKWLGVKNTKWEIVEVTPEEFIKAYKKVKFDLILKNLFISLLKEKIHNHGKLVRLLAARKIGGPIQAGFACVDIPEAKQSYHLISFHDQDAKNDSVGTGLIDEWFLTSIAKGFKFLDFCVFWAPGEDKKWKGFSRFKRQFGVEFIDYPKPFIKFIKAVKKAYF